MADATVASFRMAKVAPIALMIFSRETRCSRLLQYALMSTMVSSPLQNPPKGSGFRVVRLAKSVRIEVVQQVSLVL